LASVSLLSASVAYGSNNKLLLTSPAVSGNWIAGFFCFSSVARDPGIYWGFTLGK
jgi:hypothetical protein